METLNTGVLVLAACFHLCSEQFVFRTCLSRQAAAKTRHPDVRLGEFIYRGLTSQVSYGEKTSALQDLCHHTPTGKSSAAEIMKPTERIRLRVPIEGALN